MEQYPPRTSSFRGNSNPAQNYRTFPTRREPPVQQSHSKLPIYQPSRAVSFNSVYGPSQQPHSHIPVASTYNLHTSHQHPTNSYQHVPETHISYGPLSGYQQPLAKRNQLPFRYTSSSALFAGDWGIGDYVAVASYGEDPYNGIDVLRVYNNGSNPPSFSLAAKARMTFPSTKVCWEPFTNSSLAPKLLSSGETLKLWEINSQSNIPSSSTSSLSSTSTVSAQSPLVGSLNEVAILTKRSKSAIHGNTISAPITSFDWSSVNSAMVVTSSIDTTCTIWDLNTLSVTTQLIAHDKEVFDVSFIPNGTTNQFVSVSADGSARLFDVRSLNNSIIIYESEPNVPLLRVSPSPMDSNLVCTVGQDQNSVALLDLRATRNPISILNGHQAPVNSIKWIPGSRNLLATGGDDCQILAWNVHDGSIVGCYNDSSQVNNVLCSPDGQWLGSITGKSLQAISTQF